MRHKTCSFVDYHPIAEPSNCCLQEKKINPFSNLRITFKLFVFVVEYMDGQDANNVQISLFFPIKAVGEKSVLGTNELVFTSATTPFTELVRSAKFCTIRTSKFWTNRPIELL